MSNIILTTPDELRAIVSEAISGAFPKPVSNPSQIDTITLNDTLELLKEHGYPTSKKLIKEIRQKVEEYEMKLNEVAEKLERERLKDTKVKQ